MVYRNSGIVLWLFTYKVKTSLNMAVILSCPICAGVRPFCIHKSYPLQKTSHIEKIVSEKLKQDFFGPCVSVFVGHNFYPNVFVGPMASLESEMQNIDNPGSWFGLDYSKIIEMRSFLLRSKQKESIFSRSKFIEENQELALAERPTDTEILFKKKPVFSFQLSEYTQPMGPVGALEKMKITENIKIDHKVENIVRDDLKAVDAAYLLYKNNQDVYKITTILSAGILGKKENKKLVPTRWSVTASDDIICKKLIEQIKDFKEMSEYLVFQSTYMDNHFIVLVMPGSWEFENFEVWATGSNWSVPTQSKIIEEYESYEGRKNYAEKQAGGYYATRLGICEYLEKIKKQAKVVVFREVGEGYTIPLGVWVCRETVRNAVNHYPKKFNTDNEALEYVKTLTKVRMEDYIKNSKVLNRRTLFSFLTRIP